MSDDPNQPASTPPAETPPPNPPAFDTGEFDIAFDGSLTDNVVVFAQMSASSYLMRASLLAIRFMGRGDANKARRDFMRVAMETFDNVSSQYSAQCFQAAMLKRAQQRRTARAAARTEEPPTGDAAP